MSEIGTLRTSQDASLMSAFDPTQTWTPSGVSFVRLRLKSHESARPPGAQNYFPCFRSQAASGFNVQRNRLANVSCASAGKKYLIAECWNSSEGKHAAGRLHKIHADGIKEQRKGPKSMY